MMMMMVVMVMLMMMLTYSQSASDLVTPGEREWRKSMHPALVGKGVSDLT